MQAKKEILNYNIILDCGHDNKFVNLLARHSVERVDKKNSLSKRRTALTKNLPAFHIVSVSVGKLKMS